LDLQQNLPIPIIILGQIGAALERCINRINDGEILADGEGNDGETNDGETSDGELPPPPPLPATGGPPTGGSNSFLNGTEKAAVTGLLQSQAKII